jgi:hypothetical protein
MRPRFHMVLLTAIILTFQGCNGEAPKDSPVVGDYVGRFLPDSGKPQPGANVTFDKKYHFREVYHNLIVEGSWKLENNTLTLKSETIGGKTIEDARKKMLAAAPHSRNPAAATSMANNLEKPIILTVSANGKYLETPYDPQVHGHTIYTKQ